MSEDSRESARLDLPQSIQGEILLFQRVDIRQLSINGALIETGFPLRVDTVHDLRMTLDDGPVVIKARIAHSHIADVGGDAVVYHSGLEFVELRPPVARAISAFLERSK